MLQSVFTPLNPSRSGAEDALLLSGQGEIGVDRSTGTARALKARLDLIRMRLVQAGGKVTRSDLSGILKQFAKLEYAPAVCRTWDEIVEDGKGAPAFSDCKAACGSLIKWVEMHQLAGGRTLARVAAQPLVRTLVGMLEDVEGNDRKTKEARNTLIAIAVKAADLKVFGIAMKETYGFDMYLPGAEVYSDPSTTTKKKLVMGEREVNWVLEILSEAQQLSSMIAVFETFDTPAPAPPTYDSTFFENSFSLTSPPGGYTTPLDLPLIKTPHPIGTKAFVLMIEAAGQMGKGALVRHYFNELAKRWHVTSSERVRRMEEAVGIETGADLVLTNSSAELVASGEFPLQKIRYRSTNDLYKLSLPGPTSEIQPLTPPFTSPSTSTSIPLPREGYHIRSTLVKHIVQSARSRYDSVTGRYIRLRSMRILKLMDQHTKRVRAVLERLEPPAPSTSTQSIAQGSEMASVVLPTSTSSSIVTSERALSPTTSSPAPPLPHSILALQKELAYTHHHSSQILLMLDQIKIIANVLQTYRHKRRLIHTRSVRSRRSVRPPHLSAAQMNRSIRTNGGSIVSGGGGGGAGVGSGATMTMTPIMERKEHQILKVKIWLGRYRLKRLQQLGKASPGNWEYDRLVADLRALNEGIVGRKAEGVMRRKVEKEVEV